MTWRRVAWGLSTAFLCAGLAACGSSAPKHSTSSAVSASSGAASIASVPVRRVHTGLGTVAYRMEGSGPPLVLIMGYAGTMEVWDPQFVDTLAQRYRVVIFDNAGVGQTQALRSPLTIDAMADQTSGLITALGLGRPSVLGWSMGGMIAQALAVRHPGQVRRLVLCATFPGDGRTVVPAQRAIQALTNGDTRQTIADLYPADQLIAYQAFSTEISRYPSSAPVPGGTVAAQASASLRWFHGTDPASRQIAGIRVPALVTDGTEDVLDPVVNDHVLAGQIPGSGLVLYPDAGHAFMFQEGAPFAFQVESFLSGAPRQLSRAQMRSGLHAADAEAKTATKRWAAKAAALRSAHATTKQVVAADQVLVNIITAYDDRLLSLGATGTVGAAIGRLVAASARLSNDIFALLQQTSGSVASWRAADTRDTAAATAAGDALHRDLGLPPTA